MHFGLIFLGLLQFVLLEIQLFSELSICSSEDWDHDVLVL